MQDETLSPRHWRNLMTHKIFRPTAIAISMLAGTALCGSGFALAQDAMPGADAGMMTTNKTMAKDDAEILDRKSVVEGKSVSVRVSLGGRRMIKKKPINNIRRSTVIED